MPTNTLKSHLIDGISTVLRIWMLIHYHLIISANFEKNMCQNILMLYINHSRFFKSYFPALSFKWKKFDRKLFYTAEQSIQVKM